MTIQEIKKELTERHLSFVNYVSLLSESDFTLSFQNKWTAGQQLDHICRATSLLPLGLKMPVFIVRLLFGKPKRQSLDYPALVKKYSTILANGGKASGIFIPKPIDFNSRDELKSRLLNTVSKINHVLDNLTEEELDKSLLPHPLLGKLTIREMMYFTLYHVDHHKEKTKQNLELARYSEPINQKLN